MFKNELVQTIIELQKQNVKIFMTDAGYRELLKLINEDEMAKIMEGVG
jgi:hypothetical protein